MPRPAGAPPRPNRAGCPGAREGVVQTRSDMTIRSGPWVWVPFVAALGCGSDGSPDESSDRTPAPNCPQPSAPRSLAWSERSPLGFSADEVLAALGAQFEGRLTYADGTTTALTVGLERGSGDVEYRESPFQDAGLEPMGEPICFYGVLLPATLSLTTNDGAFAETWPALIVADSATAAFGGVSPVILDTLMGSYTVSELDPAQYDDVWVQLSITFKANLWSGHLSMFATKALYGPDGPSRVDGSDIGTF
jgi:hypothetical protein